MVKTIIDSETGYLFTNDVELVQKELDDEKKNKVYLKIFIAVKELF